MTSGLEGSPVCYSTYKLGFWELVPFILKALEGRAAAKEAPGGMVCWTYIPGGLLLQQEGGGEPPGSQSLMGRWDRAALVLEGGRRGLRSGGVPDSWSVPWSRRHVG